MISPVLAFAVFAVGFVTGALAIGFLALWLVERARRPAS